jgi:hypothetical protein
LLFQAIDFFSQPNQLIVQEQNVWPNDAGYQHKEVPERMRVAVPLPNAEKKAEQKKY